MIENLFWLGCGLVVGVTYHAFLQPHMARAWAWLKDTARKYGIGVRRDNG